MGTRTSLEIELQICYDYEYTDMTFLELEEKWGLSRPTITKICDVHQIPRRNQSKPIGHTEKISIDENYFENIDNPDKAYWLGFIAADAAIRKRTKILSKSKRESAPWYELIIDLSTKDLSHLKKFQKALKSNHEIKFKKVLLNGKIYETCRIEISRKKLCEDLIKHGIGPDKSSNLELPKISNELLPFNIRGMIDGDGSFSIIKAANELCFHFISPVYNYIIEFRNYIAQKCNLPSDNVIYSKKGETALNFRYGGNKQLRKLVNFVYTDIGERLDRKADLCSMFYYKYDLLKLNGAYIAPLKNNNLFEDELNDDLDFILHKYSK